MWNGRLPLGFKGRLCILHNVDETLIPVIFTEPANLYAYYLLCLFSLPNLPISLDQHGH
jgi:hypothetical protein